MEKLNEPIPLFSKRDRVTHKNLPYVILTVHTYCCCCSRFLDAAKYSMVANSGEVIHKVSESDLKFEEE